MKTDRIILTEALKQWCDPQLVRRIETEERSYSAYEMNSTSFFQLTPQTQRNPTARHSWKVGPDFSALGAAWKELIQDFRRRIMRREIYLEGVQMMPELRVLPEPIPSTWASDMQFDFEAEAVSVRGVRFSAVTCSLEPPNETVSIQPAASDAAAPPPADASTILDDVSTFTDEKILALLEEHARRVIAGPDARLIPPGRISLLPIIKHKMEYRAAHEGLESKLVNEAAVLADWIASKVKHYQVPKGPTIARALGKDYAALRARSNADIQSSGV